MEWIALAVLWLLEKLAGGALSDMGRSLLTRVAGLSRDVQKTREALARDADAATDKLDENAALIAELIDEMEARDADNAAMRGRIALLEVEETEAERLRAANMRLRKQNASLRAANLRLREMLSVEQAQA